MDDEVVDVVFFNHKLGGSKGRPQNRRRSPKFNRLEDSSYGSLIEDRGLARDLTTNGANVRVVVTLLILLPISPLAKKPLLLLLFFGLSLDDDNHWHCQINKTRK